MKLHTHGRATGYASDVLGRVTFRPRDAAERGDHVLVTDRLEPESDVRGYAGVLAAAALGPEAEARVEAAGVPVVHALRWLDHLEEGDVVALTPSGYVRTLYRVASPHNAVFATDRCNSYCLMCSQPPKPADDSARGAFHQTMIGLQNLARHGVPVEIRVVLHRLTVPRLEPLAECVYRNLTFASHVALMGLEPMGFAAAHLDDLWIDPYDYRDELRRATLFLARRGMNVSIYNHPLCVVPEEVRPYCRRSISDWKNDYLPVCDGCRERESCCGFFTSSLRRRHSAHVAPIG